MAQISLRIDNDVKKKVEKNEYETSRIELSEKETYYFMAILC